MLSDNNCFVLTKVSCIFKVISNKFPLNPCDLSAVQTNISEYHLEESSVLVLQDWHLSGTEISREGPCPNILSRSNKPQVFMDLCGKNLWAS